MTLVRLSSPAIYCIGPGPICVYYELSPLTNARLDADSRSQDFFSSGNGLFPAAEQVLITGNFLGDKKRISGSKWCCMFGETEVAAEFVTGNAIRCQAPLCGAGRVPLYITCNNRIACNEVCEFEYVQNPSTIAAVNATCTEDEFGLLIRLSKLLSSGAERKWSGSVLLYEAHEGCQGLHMLDERGQCIIHLAAALGYEWAISPVVAAGMIPRFRDAHGRTALHCTLQYITLFPIVFDASAIQGLFI
ncbi:calmodulin-binding transcription activator 2-like protein isoform X2 [Tanacetum coccineum]